MNGNGQYLASSVHKDQPFGDSLQPFFASTTCIFSSIIPLSLLYSVYTLVPSLYLASKSSLVVQRNLHSHPSVFSSRITVSKLPVLLNNENRREKIYFIVI